jgi:hypothetical protein
VNVIQCTYTNLVQYSLLHTWAKWCSLMLLSYKPVKNVTVLNTVGIVTQWYYNIIILWDHRRICCPSLTETSLRGAYLYTHTHTQNTCSARASISTAKKNEEGSTLQYHQKACLVLRRSSAINTHQDATRPSVAPRHPERRPDKRNVI